MKFEFATSPYSHFGSFWRFIKPRITRWVISEHDWPKPYYRGYHIRIMFWTFSFYFPMRENFLVWKEGRQGSGYWKLKLLESKLLKFDLYILKFPTGSYIDWHRDPAVEGHKHWRLNWIFWKGKGGQFEAEPCDPKDYPISKPRLNMFRPDKVLHCVSKIESSTRYVFSLGWLTKE
jgi:hypothetical protein